MCLRTNMDKHPKSGVYRYRKTVPPELRPFLPPPFTGQHTLTKSLGTKDPKDATRLHIAVSAAMERVLDQARANHAAANAGTPAPVRKPSTAPWAKALEAIAQQADDYPLGALDIGELTGALVPTYTEISSPAWQPPPPSAEAHSIAAVFAAYRREVQPTDKSADEFKRSWQLFCNLVGLTMESPITAPTKALVREFKQAILDYPANAMTKELRAMTARQLVEHARAQGLKPIAKKTVAKHIAALSAVCKFAVVNDYRLDDPTVGMNIKIDASYKEDAKNEPYSAAELKRIFSSPMFEDKPWGHKQWLPVLALFTGARAEEICQLLVSDVCQEDGVWILSITPRDDNGNVVKYLKTATSKRKVPLHPRLIELGFVAFVNERRQAGEEQVFHELTPYRGKMSPNWSKWWGRFLRAKVRISDSRKVFHSFRHTFKDACRKAIPDEEIRDRLVGHANGSVGRDYGGGHGLVDLAKWVAKISYEVEIKRS